MNSIKRSRFLIFPLLSFLGCLVLYSCDVLEQDVNPEDPRVEITGNEVYMVTDGKAYIDLQSLVKSQANVRLDISDQPRKGELNEIVNGVLQYSPQSDFNQGRDAFKFSIYSESDKLLLEDSVIIIIEPDSTNLPCGIYPQDDHAFGVTSQITIDVLANDILCGDTANLKVEVLRPQTLAATGTAIVQNNKIVYTPLQGATASDAVLYKVVDESDSSRFGFGLLYVHFETPCEFEVGDDEIIFQSDSVTSDTVYVNVFANDALCSRSIAQYQRDIIFYNNADRVFFSDSASIVYIFPESVAVPYVDSLAYKLCYQQQCQTARVYIKVE
ncbi:MAG: Ig-like domain-containing protein [Bacteroidota bacterium]